MTQAIANNINNVFKYKERIFIFLLVGISLLIVAYSYFLHSAIANVVEREKIVKEIRTVSTAVGELESQYFALKSEIDMDLAHSKGFKDSEISMFISKKSLTAMAHANEL